MKLATVFLLVTLVQVSAAGLAQTVTYREKNASLEQVFREIRRQTDFNVLATAENLAAAGRRDVNFHGASVEEVLRVCLAGTGLVYAIEKRTILIKERPVVEKVPDFFSEEDKTQMEVKGKVANVKGDPLPGVTVVIKGTRYGTVTGMDGSFRIGVNQDDILVFSLLGYSTVETSVHGQSIINVILKEEAQTLNEVVINAGYYEVDEKMKTGNIVRIGKDEIEKQPVSNPLSALQARVPGLEIIQQTGVPGGNFTVRIRGRNSILNGNDPLYIIDGVPFTSKTLSLNIIPPAVWTVFCKK